MEGTNVRIIQVKLPDEFSLLISGKIALKMQTIKKPKKSNREATSKMTPQDKMEIATFSVDFIPPFSIICI